MTGAARKISGTIVAITLVFAFLLASSNLRLVFAQKESEPEASPTPYTPITQGDAERAAQPEVSATPEAAPVALPPSITEPPVVPLIEETPSGTSTPQQTASPVQSASSEATPSATSAPTPRSIRP